MSLRTVAFSTPFVFALLLGTANTAMNVSLYRKWTVDPAKDLKAVSLLGSAPNILAVNPSLPVKDVATVPNVVSEAPMATEAPSVNACCTVPPAEMTMILASPLTQATALLTMFLKGGSPLLDLCIEQTKNSASEPQFLFFASLLPCSFRS